MDKSGSGSITEAQLADAMKTAKIPKALQGMSTEQIFSQLSTNSSGSISKQDFIDGIKNLVKQARHAHAHANEAVQPSLVSSLTPTAVSPSAPTGSALDVRA